MGHLRGGLGQISVLSSLFFGGVSGSALADVSAVGGTMIPQMITRGFDAVDFAVNISISAALVALLVPPSHNLILYSAAVGGSVSILDLFVAGIMPALLMTAVLMRVKRWIAVRRGFPTEVFPGACRRSRFISALPGLMLVALIFIGIRSGIFTAVESAAVAVAYALLVTARPVSLDDRVPLARNLRHGARTTSGLILFVIGAASAFGWLLAYLEVPQVTVELLRRWRRAAGRCC